MTVRWNSRAAIAALAPAVNKGVLEIAGLVEAKAADMMLTSSGGETYNTFFVTLGSGAGRIVVPAGNRAVHTASAPGDAPAVDTGRLINSSQVEGFPTEYRAVVRWTAPEAMLMQLGTDRVAPRPFATLALSAVAPMMPETMAANMRVAF